MYHPWRDLRSRSHLVLASADLPSHLHGAIERDGRVLLARDLLQVERRCTLAHELVHDEWGVPEAYDPAEERRVEQEAAHRLVPLGRLIDVARWTSDLHEAADELWVTVDVLRTRIEHLHPSEWAAVHAALSEGESLDGCD